MPGGLNRDLISDAVADTLFSPRDKARGSGGSKASRDGPLLSRVTWEVFLGQQGETSVSNMFFRVSPTAYAMHVVEIIIVECRHPLGALPLSLILASE